MRLLVIHNLKRGGAWRRLHEQTSRIDADVIELTLDTAAPVTATPHVVSYVARAPGLNRALRPPLRYLDAARLAYAWHRVALLARDLRPDVIFANPCQFLQAPPVLISRSVPSLYFCDEPRRVDHEPEASATRNPRTRPLYAPLYAYERRLDSIGVRRATGLATNSRYTAERLRDAYGVDAAVIPMGVAEQFRCGRLEDHRENVVLSVGMLTAVKGHDLVILATARSRELRQVVIVSPRPDTAMQERLHRLASAVGVKLQIRVGISDEELRREYTRARLTAYLARGEPFGLAALEAQACGCPVVTSDDGGLPEAIVHGVTGFAVARDADAAARAFDELCDPTRSARVQAAAAAFARPRSWDASADRLADLLSTLAPVR